MNQATRLRERIRQSELLVGVGACNALEARLIESAGFDFIWSSGFAISASYALPDANILSMTELLEATRAMCGRINIPVVADCDTGFGNANNVIYAVDEFRKAGAAAISMEDKKFPKDTSLLPGGRQHLVSIEEFSGKVRAAVDARRDSDLVVIARTEALIAGWGVEEALSRAHHYCRRRAPTAFWCTPSRRRRTKWWNSSSAGTARRPSSSSRPATLRSPRRTSGSSGRSSS